MNTEELKSIIATRLKSARGDLRQQDIADKSGVERTNISYYETKTALPPVQNLVRLCEALGVNPNYLLGFNEIPGLNNEEEEIIKMFRSLPDAYSRESAKSVLNTLAGVAIRHSEDGGRQRSKI